MRTPPRLIPTPKPKRRKAIAALLVVQSAMFGWGCLVAVVILLSGPGHPELPNQLRVAIEAAAGSAVSALLATFTLRGSRTALYATAVLAGLSTVIDLGVFAIELLWMGPFAVLYLLFYPLPNVPLGAVAIPILILSLNLIAEGRRRLAVSSPLDA